MNLLDVKLTIDTYLITALKAQLFTINKHLKILEELETRTKYSTGPRKVFK